ncbi:hypothetical protein KP509_26G003200 [Ceratopteris richardii]|uniref:Uncharacterized protein n=1 Tax=Ceratopteris richardii TaxID=49495 RepID=A0A8T2RHX1_CERRI|nr:hypothetical protein KP509_26G003200 [Ceratopteris richardii]
MESSISEPLLERTHKHSLSPHVEDGTLVTEDLACAAAGCGLSDVRNRAEDAENRSVATKKLDVAGFAISLFAIWASSWEATPRQSYGFFRLEILGALLSIQLIWLLTGIIVYEAIYRMIHSSQQIDGRLMFIVAAFGFFVNVIMVFLLGHHHGHDHHDHGHQNGHGHHEVDHNHSIEHVSNHDGHSPSIEGHAYADAHEKVHKHEIHVHDHDDGDENTPLLISRLQEAGYSCKENQRRESFKVDMDIKQRDSSEKNRSKFSNINVKGAWLHVLGDLIQSIGVMIGGAIIWWNPEWKVVDLICTLLFSIIVLGTTIKILRDIMEVLMESTPREIDAKKLEKGLCQIEGVIAVHDLHIWAITMGKTLLACHVTIYYDANADVVLQRVINYCEEVFNIGHVTFQIERQRQRSPS